VVFCRNIRILKKDFLACNPVRLELVHIYRSLAGPVTTLVYDGEKFVDLYFDVFYVDSLYFDHIHFGDLFFGDVPYNLL
jgi:hypothetical protein